MALNRQSHRASLERQQINCQNSTLNAYQMSVDYKSLKQSPEVGSLFWLRSTQHGTDKCGSNQKVGSNCKAKMLETRKAEHNYYHHVKVKPLEKCLDICLQSALYIVQAAIKQCLIYHNRLGFSYFNIKNCYLSEENKLVIISHNSIANAYVPVHDETVVVRDIVQSVHKICSSKCFDDFYSYYRRSALKSKCDYKYALSLINSYCLCSKISIADCVKIDNISGTAQKFEKIQHPKSAERITHFKRLTIGQNRKSSVSKSNRESFYLKHFNNRSKQKLEASSRGEKKQQGPSQVDVITIQNKYNFSGNKLIEQGERKQIIKESTVSTNFKSSLHHGDSLQVSTINIKNRFSEFNSRASETKQYFSFLPIDLDEVQSIGQSSEHQSQLPARNFQTASDIYQQNRMKQNEERILSINNWTRKVQGLLSEQRDLKQSINEDSNKQNNQCSKVAISLQKFARTNVGRGLQMPSQLYSKKS